MIQKNKNQDKLHGDRLKDQCPWKMRYFLDILQLDYGGSKLIRVFWIRQLEVTTWKILINAKIRKSIFPASNSFLLDMSNVFNKQ